MLSTFSEIWKAVRLRCPAADPFLARQWVNYAFRQVVEKRRWSWLIKRGQFLVFDLYSTGTVAATFGDPTVVGTGTAWSTDLVGRQFRIGTQFPIYTISDVPDATTLSLSEPWGGDTVTGQGYEVYNAYVTCPTDFHAFVSIWDPKFNWQLYTNVTQFELNQVDAQRTNSGTAYVVANYAYSNDDPPLPMYEIWPHQKSQYVYPFLYECRPPDLSDSGASLPRYIRGDVLLEMALAQAARWPGASLESPNPYFNLNLAVQHDARAQKMIFEMEVNDDNVYEDDLTYSTASMNFAALPFGDSRWLQSHA